MSIKAMTAVFDHSQSTLGARLVLLAIADYAHDDGSQAFPSIPTLAKKAKISERATQYAILALENIGELVREPRTTPNGTTSNMYTVVLPGLAGGAKSAPGEACFTGGVQNLHRGGAKSAPGGVKRASPDPLTDPLDEPSIKNKQKDSTKSARTKTLIDPDWWPSDELRAEIKEEFPGLTNYAAETQHFIDSAIANARTYANWDLALKNWFRQGIKFGSLAHKR